MASVPSASAEVVQTAIPESASTALVQPEIPVPLEVKSTVPVGPAGLTVAVRVTSCPTSDGLGVLVRTVVVVVSGVNLKTVPWLLVPPPKVVP